MVTKLMFLGSIATPPQPTFYCVEFNTNKTVLVAIDQKAVTINKMTIEENAQAISIQGLLSTTLVDYPMEKYYITKDEQVVSRVVRFPNEIVVEYWLENDSIIVFDTMEKLLVYIGDRYTLEKI